jgi:hypothetical protein
MNLVSSSGINVVKYSVELSYQILGVGLSIRFGKNPSISVGRSGTPSKSVEYQPKLFLKQNSWSSSNFRSDFQIFLQTTVKVKKKFIPRLKPIKHIKGFIKTTQKY